MSCTCDDPVYGTCDECGRVGYEVHACGTCGAEICPFCDHWCAEDDYS